MCSVKIYRLSILLFLCFSTNTLSFADGNPWRNFGPEQGLPSPETYFIHEDSKGYIWVGTDRGLCRYDGYDFQTFTTANSKLTCNTVFKCYENRSVLWFTCYDGTISQYNLNTEVFIPYIYNDSLSNWFQYWPKRVDFFSDHVKIYGYNDNYNYAEHFFNTNFISFKRISNTKYVGSYHKVQNGKAVRLFKKDHAGFVSYFNDDVNFFSDSSGDARRLIDYAINQQEGVIFCDEYSLLLSKDGIISQIKEFNEPIQYIYRGPLNSQLFVLTNDALYRQIHNTWVKEISGYNFSYILIDSEGSYWCSTLSDGVIYIPGPTTFSTKGPVISSTVTSMHPIRENLLLGTSAEEVISVNKSDSVRNLVRKFSGLASDLKITSMTSYHHSVFTTGGLQFDHNSGELQTLEWGNCSEIKGFVQMKTGDVVYYTYGPNAYFKNHTSTITLNTSNEHIISISVGHDDVVRCGSTSGLWNLVNNNNDLIFTKDTNPIFFKNRINCITEKPPNTVIYGSGSSGVILEKEGNFVVVDRLKGLVNDVVNAMYFHEDTVLWIASNKGVSKLIIKDNIDASYVEFSLNSDDGLISNYIYSISCWNGCLWLGTDKGLQRISYKDLEPKRVPPRIYINDILVNGVKKHDKIKIFEHYDDDIRLEFLGICFKKPKQGFYRYRLQKDNELERGFTYTDDTYIDLVKLSPGNYRFEIACRNKANLWSDTKQLQFTILPHFSQTIMFKTIASICILLALIFGGKRQFALIKERSLNEKKMEKLAYRFQALELNVLKNQMNPHFVFNALNSIQSYVLSNNIKTASNYIQQFSSLMRESLEYSSSDQLLLEKEVDFLNNYLRIEQLRFPNKFKYSISVTPKGLKEEVFIPPLLVQPIVENCVKHAFSSVESGGEIRVEFIVSDKSIKCFVIDNGIGINKGRKKKKVGRKSYGTKVVENRLNLIYGDESINITYTDLSELEQDSTGTKVEINLPKL